MLLGPSTEKVTYVLVAPTLMWGALEAWRVGGRGARWLWAATVALFLVDQILPPPSRSAMLAHPWLRCASPAAAALTASLLLGRAATELRRGGASPVESAPATR